MKPAPVTLPVIWRGCDWAAIVTRWKDGNGNPINLAGWVPLVRTNAFDLNPAKTDAVNGVVTISLTRAQTQSLRLGVYRWNWLFYAPVQDVLTAPLLGGKVEVKDPILDVP